MTAVTLDDYLRDWTLEGATRAAVADTVKAIARSSISVSELVARGALAGRLGRVTARAGEFDEQKEIVAAVRRAFGIEP